MRSFFHHFIWTQTPLGHDKPPLISVKVILLVSGTPTVWALADMGGQSQVVLWYLLLVLSSVFDCLTGYQRFFQGMRAGRDEMTAEMWLAWEKYEMAPGDYLMRETYFADDGAWPGRGVGRTARQRPRPSSPSS
jgi:hypothetical protein